MWFRCPKCGQKIGVAPTRAGQPCNCPSCREKLVTPAAEMLSPDEPASAQTKPRNATALERARALVRDGLQKTGAAAEAMRVGLKRRWSTARPRWRLAALIVTALFLCLLVRGMANAHREHEQARQVAERAAAEEAQRQAAETTQHIAEAAVTKAIAANDARWEQRLAADHAQMQQTLEAERQRTAETLAQERARTTSALSAAERRVATAPAQPSTFPSQPERRTYEIKMATPPPRQEQCLACRGSGKVQCPDCRGTGVLSCKTCKGTGIVKKGFFSPTDAYCDDCKGKGTVKCGGWFSGCNGKGVVDCSKCSGTGKVTLNN